MLLLFLLSFQVIARGEGQEGHQFKCPLSKSVQHNLINDSPYFVDHVQCSRIEQFLRWEISNKRVLGNPKRPLIKSRKKSRGIASIKSKRHYKGATTKSIHQFTVGIGSVQSLLDTSQEGELSNAKFNFFQNKGFSLFTSWGQNHWKVTTLVDKNSINFDLGANQQTRDLYNYLLKTYYKGVFVGIHNRQMPVFNNNLDDTIISSTSLLLGYSWQRSLSWIKNTSLTLELLASYNFHNATSSQVTISNSEGKGVGFAMNLSHQLFSITKLSSIHAFWKVSAMYSEQSMNIQWSTSSEELPLKTTKVSSLLGVGYHF